MLSRRQLLRWAGTAGIVALAGCNGSGGGTPTAEPTTEHPTETPVPGATGTAAGTQFSVSTPAFEDGETIPERYTGVGADVSPELRVEGVPPAAETLAITVLDPDANGFVHWLIWNVPRETTTIPEGLPQRETVDSLDGARQGTNGFDELGYRGPLPPTGEGPHTYRFTASAVDGTPDLAAGATLSDLQSALEGHVLATASVTGEFER